jgi:hypothetical protein
LSIYRTTKKLSTLSQVNATAKPSGVRAVVSANNLTATGNATASVVGQSLAVARNDPKALAKLRKQLREIFREPYTRALALVIVQFGRKPIKTLYRYLDEMRVAPPKGATPQTWMGYHRNSQRESIKLHSSVIATLKKHGFL